MNSLEIIVAVLAAMLVGIGLCGLGFFCVFMLRGMNKLQESAGEVVKASSQSLAEAKAVVAQVKDIADRNFGENSPTARAARAVSTLSENVPQIVGGLKGFSETMSLFNRFAIQGQPKPVVSSEEVVDDSQFVPYSEEAAAQFEVERRARAERYPMTEQELAGMRTDRPIKPKPATEPPVEPEPAPEPEPPLA